MTERKVEIMLKDEQNKVTTRILSDLSLIDLLDKMLGAVGYD